MGTGVCSRTSIYEFSYYGNAASSSLGRAFCRCLGLMELFSLVVLVGADFKCMFSFDLPGFTDCSLAGDRRWQF